jgi:hypothetical protein
MSEHDWIQPGAPVVIYDNGAHRDSPAFRETTVKTVAMKSFTVDGLDDRFSLATLMTKLKGREWSRWRWVAIAPDSPRARKLRMDQRRGRLRSEAIDSVADWNTGAGRDDLAKLDAAIDALTDFREALRETPDKG